MYKLIVSLLFSISALGYAQAQTTDEKIDAALQKAQGGELTEAYNVLTAIITTDTSNARAFYERAFLLQSKQADFQKLQLKLPEDDLNTQIIADATRAIQLKANYSEAIQTRATTYIMTDKNLLAIADLNALIALHPEDANTYNTRSQLLYNTQQYTKALEDLSWIIAQKTPLAEKEYAYIQRGMTHYLLNNTKKSAADFTFAINNKLNAEKATSLRGMVYSTRGQALRGCIDLASLKYSTDTAYTGLYTKYNCKDHHLARPDFKESECTQFKTGTFKSSAAPLADYRIVRTKNKQVEYINKNEVVCSITWKNNIEYIITIESTTIPGYQLPKVRTMYVKITDVKDNAYSFTSSLSGNITMGTLTKVPE